MKKELEDWAETMNKLSAEIEKLNAIFNNPDCALKDAIDSLQVKYTCAVAEKIGDRWELLLWYWQENDMGINGWKAGYKDGELMEIKDLSALEDLIRIFSRIEPIY